MKHYLIILWLHWLADFVLQTDEMARRKSSSNYWLGRHVLIYFAAIVCMWPFAPEGKVFEVYEWALLNAILHFGVDYVTSRISSKLHKKGDIHNFFVVIGLDQAIHFTCLFVSFKYLVLDS